MKKLTLIYSLFIILCLSPQGHTSYWEENYNYIYNSVTGAFSSLYEMAYGSPKEETNDKHVLVVVNAADSIDKHWKNLDGDLEAAVLFTSEEFIRDLQTYYTALHQITILLDYNDIVSISVHFFDRESFDYNVKACEQDLARLVSYDICPASKYFRDQRIGLRPKHLTFLQNQYSTSTIQEICINPEKVLCVAIGKSLFSYCYTSIDYFWKKYRCILTSLRL